MTPQPKRSEKLLSFCSLSQNLFGAPFCEKKSLQNQTKSVPRHCCATCQPSEPTWWLSAPKHAAVTHRAALLPVLSPLLLPPPLLPLCPPLLSLSPLLPPLLPLRHCPHLYLHFLRHLPHRPNCSLLLTPLLHASLPLRPPDFPLPPPLPPSLLPSLLLWLLPSLLPSLLPPQTFQGKPHRPRVRLPTLQHQEGLTTHPPHPDWDQQGCLPKSQPFLPASALPFPLVSATCQRCAQSSVRPQAHT